MSTFCRLDDDDDDDLNDDDDDDDDDDDAAAAAATTAAAAADDDLMTGHRYDRQFFMVENARGLYPTSAYYLANLTLEMALNTFTGLVGPGASGA
jgi:hypothetical protein